MAEQKKYQEHLAALDNYYNRGCDCFYCEAQSRLMSIFGIDVYVIEGYCYESFSELTPEGDGYTLYKPSHFGFTLNPDYADVSSPKCVAYMGDYFPEEWEQLYLKNMDKEYHDRVSTFLEEYGGSIYGGV